MTITLTTEQMAWIEAHVGSGEFGSVEDAVRRLLDERINERDVEALGELSWMKPLVDEALAELETGSFLSLEEYRARRKTKAARTR